jgi:GNAT superfamily N-acetyltransferase
MTEAVSVGLLGDEEVEALAELARLIWLRHYPGIITPEQIDYMLARRYRPIFIRQTLARGDKWDVARGAGRLLGFAHCYPMGEGDAKLDKLYVHPDWQRHGIGRLLLARVETHARRWDCRRLVLRVNRHNVQALAAYASYGFTRAAEVREDIGNGFVMDDYVMVKSL